MRARPPAQPNASLISGLECLREVAANDGALGVREMARRLGMEPTRAHRLMKTLSSQGYLVQNESGKYESGPAMHILSARSLRGSGLIARAMPALNALSPFKSVIALGMLWRTEVVYLLHTRIGEAISSSLAREPVFPATRSSIGLALIARWTDEEVRETYPAEIPGFDSPDTLLAELARIREAGHAVAEYSPGVYSVGLALDEHSAIALGSLKDESRIPDAVEALKEARKIILGPKA